MIVSFNINRDAATIAIMYCLGLGIRIEDKTEIDDHEIENEEFRNAADSLVDKYFK